MLARPHVGDWPHITTELLRITSTTLKVILHEEAGNLLVLHSNLRDGSYQALSQLDNLSIVAAP